MLDYQRPAPRTRRRYLVFIAVVVGALIVSWTISFVRVSRDTALDVDLGIEPSKLSLGQRLFWSLLGALCPTVGVAVVAGVALATYSAVRRRG
jgi:hypothetical protein